MNIRAWIVENQRLLVSIVFNKWRWNFETIPSPEILEDMVQETIVILLRNYPRFDPAKGRLETFVGFQALAAMGRWRVRYRQKKRHCAVADVEKAVDRKRSAVDQIARNELISRARERFTNANLTSAKLAAVEARLKRFEEQIEAGMKPRGTDREYVEFFRASKQLRKDPRLKECAELLGVM